MEQGSTGEINILKRKKTTACKTSAHSVASYQRNEELLTLNVHIKMSKRIEELISHFTRKERKTNFRINKNNESKKRRHIENNFEK